jgi:hypothetical protein
LNPCFTARQHHYNKVVEWQNAWTVEYAYILSTLKLLSFENCKSIVELGCADGALASCCLDELSWIEAWHGYDISPYWIENTVSHERYFPHLLETDIWMLPLDSFDIFVSSHTLEHLYAEEIEHLTEWLSRKTRYVIVSAPLLKDRGIVKGNHVLDKGSTWLKETLKENGFSLIWNCGQWFGWFLNST